MIMIELTITCGSKWVIIHRAMENDTVGQVLDFFFNNWHDSGLRRYARVYTGNGKHRLFYDDAITISSIVVEGQKTLYLNLTYA